MRSESISVSKSIPFHFTQLPHCQKQTYYVCYDNLQASIVCKEKQKNKKIF